MVENTLANTFLTVTWSKSITFVCWTLNVKCRKKVQSVQTPDRRFPSSSLPLSPHTPVSSQTPNQSQWLRGFTCLHPFLGNWTIHGYLCSLPGNFTFRETALSEQCIPSFICWRSRFFFCSSRRDIPDLEYQNGIMLLAPITLIKY